MYQARCLGGFGLVLALFACTPASEDASDTAGASATPAETVAELDPPMPSGVTTGSTINRSSIGPVHYAYDPKKLTRAEIDLPLPPDFADTVFAVKLIPVEYAANIGTKDCSYGISPDNHICTAQEEVGLELALLERPLADYRARLEGAKPALEAVTLARQTGFGLTTTLGNTTRRYVFVPSDERTLLVAQRSASGQDAGREALDDALASVDLNPPQGRQP